ncbi:hypothetical protein AAIH16_38285, partial [Pseudomonas aeruginosa]
VEKLLGLRQNGQTVMHGMGRRHTRKTIAQTTDHSPTIKVPLSARIPEIICCLRISTVTWITLSVGFYPLIINL